MIHTMLQTKVLLYLMTATGLLGILCQIVGNRCYRQLLREAADTQPEKGEFLKRIRYRYQIDSRCCGGNVNIPVFVQKILMDYRYRKLTLHQWRRQAAGWYIVSAAIAAAGIWYYQIQHNQGNLMMMIRAIGAVTVLNILAALWCDSPYKEKKLMIQIQDYLSHSGIGTGQEEKVREEWREENGEISESGLGKKKAEPVFTRAQKEKRQLQENLSRTKNGERETAAGLEKDWDRERNREILKQMDAKEQERIIREVLAEFLA